jgi:hypothetical protein
MRARQAETDQKLFREMGAAAAGYSSSIRKFAVKLTPAAVIINANVPNKLRLPTGGGFSHIRAIVSQMPTISRVMR